MKHNVGAVDRSIRLLVGLGIVGAGIYYGSWWGVVGIVPVFTALTRWCPVYTLFGISSCKNTNVNK